jgi:hypothetical protein
MPHVVEIHGLTRATTTTDLELFLLDYHWGGLAPSIRWVDDAHCLAVFPCKEAAVVLLEARQRAFGVRAYCEASEGAHERPAEGEFGGGWEECCVCGGGSRGGESMGVDALGSRAHPHAYPTAQRPNAFQFQPPELAPPRGARPKTTTAVARRLIGNALGVGAAVGCGRPVGARGGAVAAGSRLRRR